MNALERANKKSEEFLNMLEQKEYQKAMNREKYRCMRLQMEVCFSDDMENFLLAYSKSEEFRKKARPVMETRCIGKDDEHKEINIRVVFNLLLFVAYNLSLNKNIYNDVNDLYEEYGDIFDEVRISNADLLDNCFSTVVPFSCLDMYKKLIVIMASITDKEREISSETEAVKYFSKGYIVMDFEVQCEWFTINELENTKCIGKDIQLAIQERFNKILIKSNKKLYRKVKNLKKFSLSGEVLGIMFQLSGLDNKATENIMQRIGKLAVTLSFCKMEEIEIIEGDQVALIGETFLYPLAFLVDRNNGIDFSEENSEKQIDISYEEEKEIVNSILSGMQTDSNMLLFAKERQSINRFVVGSPGISSKDIQDIRSIYYQMEQEEAPYSEFFTNAVYTILLLRTLAQYEKGYDELIECSEKQKREIYKSEQISVAAKQIMTDYSVKKKALEEENRQLKEQMAEMEKHLNSTAAELEKEKQEKKQEKKELIALRNYVYENGHGLNTSEEMNTDLTVEEMKEDLKKRNVIIIGGHQNWNNKMKAIFPDWTYIAAEQKVVTETMIANKELVLVFEEHCKHSLYYKVISSLGENTKLGYIGKSVNIDLCVEKIYELAHKS